MWTIDRLRFAYSCCVFFLASACGEIPASGTFLKIKMRGVFEQPVTSTLGNRDPLFIVAKLANVFITTESGESLSIFEGDPQSFKVIDRNLLIYEKKLSDSLIGVNFTDLTVEFEPEIGMAGKLNEGYTATLEVPQVSYTVPFIAKEFQTINFVVKVLWKDTVLRDEASEPPTESVFAPSLSLTLDD